MGRWRNRLAELQGGTDMAPAVQKVQNVQKSERQGGFEQIERFERLAGLVAAPANVPAIISDASRLEPTSARAETEPGQQGKPALPPSHALGLAQWDTSEGQPKPAGGTPSGDTEECEARHATQAVGLSGKLVGQPNGTAGQPYGAALAALRKGCPEMVDVADWKQALRDAETFMPRWGEKAKALGWTARELFGLHPVPRDHAPNYRRLSRYDATGLIWLLQGKQVTELSADTAAIRWPSGSITVYRKSNKPALGPLGDSLDDFK